MGIEHLSAKTVAVIVAHPDDETLWAGGVIISHPEWNWFIVTLCRGKDADRSVKFKNVLKFLNAKGIMGDMDDGPEQTPLDDSVVEQTILALLPRWHYDLIITHNPAGEYTRHLRHEEAGKAVINLWNKGKLSTSELWTFAYEDDNKKKYPEAVENASICIKLEKLIWQQKYRIMTSLYGFEAGGFEAQTTPESEAFWQFNDPGNAKKWLGLIENMKIVP